MNGGMEIVGIAIQVLILFSLVIITDRLLKIQRHAEHIQESREQGGKALESIVEAIRKLGARFEAVEASLKGEQKKPTGAKPRSHPEARKTRKICPNCEAFIPVDDPRCSNCGHFFDGKD